MKEMREDDEEKPFSTCESVIMLLIQEVTYGL